MGKFNISQNSFSFGELSPTVKGRTDLKEYKQGVEEFKNMLSMRAGGGNKRPGFKFQFELPTTNGDGLNTAILPFNPNDDTGYYIVLTTDGNISSTSNLKIYKIDGTVCTINILLFASSTFPSNLDPLGWRYTQSVDVLFVTHNSGLVRPFVIMRTADTSFTAVDYRGVTQIKGTSRWIPTPFQDTNITSITLTYSGSNTLTASGALFSADDVDTAVRINNGANDIVLLITAYSSSVSVSVFEISDTFTSAISATTNWALGAWGGSNGYPTQVTMHNQRLCWMATNGGALAGASEPNKIWVSAVGNLFKMTRDTVKFTTFDSSDAFNFAIGGSKPNLIVWCEAGRSLKVGTIGEEYIVDFTVLGDDSSSYATVKQQTSHGSSDVMSVNANYSTLFVSRNKREVRQFKYNESNGSFISSNMNILSDHLFTGVGVGAIKKLIWEEGRSVLWVLADFGFTPGTSSKIFSLTFDNDSQVASWSEHPLGLEDIDTTPVSFRIRDLIVVSNGNTDEIVGIASTGFGTYVDTIVKLGDRFDGVNDVMTYTDALWPVSLFKNRPFFVDHAIISNTGTKKLVHSGFSTLDGKSVSVLADGLPAGDFTVTGGNITLTTAAYEVIAGLKYKARIKTMPIDSGGTIGDSVATVKRVDEANIRFHRTMSAKFGDHYTDGISSLEQMEFDLDGTLFSGIKTVKMPSGYDIDGDYSIVIEQDSPTPMSVLAITLKGQSGK